MSSGVPRRAQRRPGDHRVHVHGPRLDGPPHHGGVDDAGRNGVHGDAMRGQVERQRLGEGDDAALGGHVVRHVPRPRLGRRGRDRHDPAPLPSIMSGTAACRQWKVPGEIDRHHAVPRLGGDVEEVLESLDPRAGHHDLHRPEGGADLVQRGLDGGPVTDVDRHRRRGAARGRDLLGDLAAASALMSSTGDPRPGSASWWQMARPMPDPPPGDDCDAAHRRPLLSMPASPSFSAPRQARPREWCR